jgi:hypothetical protein
MNDFGNLYLVPFSVSASTAGATDVLTILAPTNSQVQLRELYLGAVSSAPPTANLEVDVYRGSTGVSTGAAITPLNLTADRRADGRIIGFGADHSADLDGVFQTDVQQRLADRVSGFSLVCRGLSGYFAGGHFATDGHPGVDATVGGDDRRHGGDQGDRSPDELEKLNLAGPGLPASDGRP